MLQEVYVTVWRKAADFDPARASPMTWLIAIARNRAIDRLRASRRSRRMEPIDAAAEVADERAGADAALRKRAGSRARCTAASADSPRMSARRCAAPSSTATPMKTWPNA